MLDYALEQLIDGMSLGGILLITLPVSLIYGWLSGRMRLFFANTLFLIFMSLPVTGKALLLPIDIGIAFEKVQPDMLRGKVDVLAIIAPGSRKDAQSSALVPSLTSFSRLKRAEMILSKVPLPLIISGSDGGDGAASELAYLSENAQMPGQLLLAFGAKGTAEHARNIARLMKEQNLKRVAVFVSGIHAYRTRAVLEAEGIEVALVIVGINDATFGWRDFIPGFDGFFYWKHALKEYAGLMVYKWRGII